MTIDELPTVGKNGRDLKVENGRIKSVSISNEDHGCLTAWLHCEMSGSGCRFGGYSLGSATGKENLKETKANWAAFFITRCIETVIGGGYGKWEDLTGEPCRVMMEGLGGGIVAVGHFIDDKWFCPREELKGVE